MKLTLVTESGQWAAQVRFPAANLKVVELTAISGEQANVLTALRLSPIPSVSFDAHTSETSITSYLYRIKQAQRD